MEGGRLADTKLFVGGGVVAFVTAQVRRRVSNGEKTIPFFDEVWQCF